MLATGQDNMVNVFASAVLGRSIRVAEPHGSPVERYLVRDIDAVPGVFSGAELLEGICRLELK